MMDVKTLKSIMDGFKKKKILVIGDIMLDHYIHGSVDRISPEAPVPVLEVKREEYRLGGSANVAENLITLGAEVCIIGIVGNDQPGKQILKQLKGKKIDTQGVFVSEERPTTVKTRIIANQQQIVRIDKEKHEDIPSSMEKTILGKVISLINTYDAVIMEDYNKGLLTEHMIESIISLCNKSKKLVAVDPQYKHLFAYRNCTVFKPNFSELQKNLGIMIETEDQFQEAVAKLEERIKAKYLIITRGEKGLTVFSKGSKVVSIPTFAREIFDVSGAGDTVISTLTLGLAAGCDIETAALIANHAAGVVCGKIGTSVAKSNEIIESFSQNSK
ncbi:MAG TPA: D-glycero-beta-D-manno-heptose-7-phosphate kinase [Candidatus Cloacimonadota bacterium]|nr:D-glycero-beta-D-manno-heptose-7-phosphate kinase [Candidatus Cloacimonadota bacterium]